MHEAVGYLDIRWASGTRSTAPFEQRLHDYLAAIPFAALSLILVLHWQDLVSLATGPIAALRDPPAFRTPPLAIGIVVMILGLVFVGNVLPYLEEFGRALRHRARSEPTRG